MTDLEKDIVLVALRVSRKYCICSKDDQMYFRFNPRCIAHDLESDIFKTFKEIQNERGLRAKSTHKTSR